MAPKNLHKKKTRPETLSPPSPEVYLAQEGLGVGQVIVKQLQ